MATATAAVAGRSTRVRAGSVESPADGAVIPPTARARAVSAARRARRSSREGSARASTSHMAPSTMTIWNANGPRRPAARMASEPIAGPTRTPRRIMPPRKDSARARAHGRNRVGDVALSGQRPQVRGDRLQDDADHEDRHRGGRWRAHRDEDADGRDDRHDRAGGHGPPASHACDDASRDRRRDHSDDPQQTDDQGRRGSGHPDVHGRQHEDRLDRTRADGEDRGGRVDARGQRPQDRTRVVMARGGAGGGAATRATAGQRHDPIILPLLLSGLRGRCRSRPAPSGGR